MKKVFLYFSGLLAGFVNGLLGAGSGNIVLPMLKASGIKDKKSHAMSVFIVLVCCISSTILYSSFGELNLNKAMPYAIFGLPGAFLGTYVTSKIDRNILEKIFAIFVIYAGVRMLMQ